MFRSVLPGSTHRALAALAPLDLITKSYLAGGSALTLQLGHRESLDLDLFTQEPFETTAAVQEFQQALVYFDDAEQDVVPKLFAPIAWDNVKKTLTDAEAADRKMLPSWSLP